MNTCAKDGYLFGGNTPLPSDPTEVHVAGLRAVPCSRLRCRACKALVRNRAGFSFKTPADVTGANLKKIYETPDWAQSPLLHQGLPEWRLYVCQCSRWLETDNNALSDPSNDGPGDPSMPWRCDGHPLAALPHDLHGVLVRTNDELHDFVVAGCRGTVPPDVRPEDVKRASWLCRLPPRLTPAHARVVVETASECVADRDPVARARALEILTVTRNAAAEQRLLALLDQQPALFVGVPNPISRFDVDSDLAGTAWRVLGPLVATSESIRDRARSMALRGRGNRAVYDALCAADSEWIVKHVEDVVRAAPAVGEDLIYSFYDLPKTYMIQPLEDRVRAVLAAK